MRIAVCIASYRRPAMLGALLDSLARLELAAEDRAATMVIVVDNDAAGSALPVVDARRPTHPFPLHVAVEPTRNVAVARNRCIALALEHGADQVAFVDDDEQVSPRWLAALLHTRSTHDADVVSGPVLNAYEPGTPRWMIEGELPVRARMPTGTRRDVAESGNVLISRALLERMPERFDARFGLTGGSDSHFFLRARQAGAQIVWADDAIVHETVPASRASVRWLLARAFRVGNAGVLVARAALPVGRWLPRRAAAACYRLARGAVLLPLALVRGRAATVAALQDVCLGAGALAALTGFRYVEYRRLHGA